MACPPRLSIGPEVFDLLCQLCIGLRGEVLCDLQTSQLLVDEVAEAEVPLISVLGCCFVAVPVETAKELFSVYENWMTRFMALDTRSPSVE